LGLAEFLYLSAERTQLLFREMKYAIAGNTAVVAGPQNLRKFTEREPDLERPSRELNALGCIRREYPISPTGPLRGGKNADPFVVTERISADASKAGQFSRAHRRGTYTRSMHPGIGSRVKLFCRL
jgi:hypothetical protein